MTEAADETEMPLPSDAQTFFLGGLFALGVLAVLYLAGAIIQRVGRAWRDLGCSHAGYPEDQF